MRKWTIVSLVCLVTVGLVLSVRPALAGAPEDPWGNAISPISNPTNFEDPRAVTDARLIYVYHSIADSFGANLGLTGGDVQVVALQLRLALTDRLALIATKDGYVFVQPNTELPGVVEQGNGWANIAFGAKYSILRDEELGMIVTGGLRYEVPSGEPQGLQGRVFRTFSGLGKEGDGVINPFLSAIWGTNRIHVLGYTGLRQALSDVDSSFYDVSLHLDYEVPLEIGGAKLGALYPTMELNWVHVLDGGTRVPPLNQEGFDFFNFGASGAGGNNVVTVAYGGRWRITDNLDVFDHKSGIDLGAVVEFPISTQADVFGWRVTTDLVFWVL